MRFLFSISLLIGGIGGLAISLLGKTVFSSSMLIINGLELSLSIGIFSIIALLSGLYTLFSTS